MTALIFPAGSVHTAQLNRLDLIPAGTVVTCYDVVNFRNRHHTPAVFPELLLGGKGCQTDTYSGDWQFAPHPTMFIFRKLTINLFFGALDLPRAFGMYLEVADFQVKAWHLDYGRPPYGQKVSAGEKFVSPRFRLFLRRNQPVYDTLDKFAKMLIEEGLIPNPEEKSRQAWWREPLLYLARPRFRNRGGYPG